MKFSSGDETSFIPRLNLLELSKKIKSLCYDWLTGKYITHTKYPSLGIIKTEYHTPTDINLLAINV